MEELLNEIAGQLLQKYKTCSTHLAVTRPEMPAVLVSCARAVLAGLREKYSDAGTIQARLKNPTLDLRTDISAIVRANLAERGADAWHKYMGGRVGVAIIQWGASCDVTLLQRLIDVDAPKSVEGVPLPAPPINNATINGE